MDVAEAFDTVFLSTPSARRATGRPVLRWYEKRISIHALCEEGDPGTPWSMEPPRIFLSTPSARRATAVSRAASCIFFQFLSTPSARRATRCPCGLHVLSHISIHALCEEGDSGGLPGGVRHGNFYPRPLRGGRRWSSNQPHNQTADFYPRPLRGGRPGGLPSPSAATHFYPRPLRGGRLGVDARPRGDDLISIHALCEEGDPHRARRHGRPGNFYPRPLRGGRRSRTSRSSP